MAVDKRFKKFTTIYKGLIDVLGYELYEKFRISMFKVWGFHVCEY
jgi:hypothetical protein